MPGRCAAPPAPAMMTLKPAALAPFAKATIRSGVRCAETIRCSLLTPSAVSVSAANRMVSQSDWLPMMMATAAVIASVQESKTERRIIGLGSGVARQAEWSMVSWSMVVAHEEETKALDSECRETPYRREGGDQTRSGRARQARKSGCEIAERGALRCPTEHPPAASAIGKGAGA